VPPEIQIYANCMDKVRQRVGVIIWAVQTVRTLGAEHFMWTELIFIQFRKILELIAFSSLTANKDKYATAYANYGSHWKAVKMLECIEKLNPDFYPVPVLPPADRPDGTKSLTFVQEGFLTREEFEQLYDICGDILHMRNPFSDKDPVLQIGHGVEVWVQKIQRLLATHLIHLVDESKKWVVVIPPAGPVKVFEAVATEQALGTTTEAV
jgi:hypothetical protein